MLEGGVVEWMSGVLLSGHVESEWCVAFIINLIGIIATLLLEKQFYEVNGTTNDRVVEGSASKVVLCSAVDPALLERVIDALEVLLRT
jgi:hypothetical protein